MKNFRIAVMLNGAEGMDWYEKLSNLYKIKEGLVSNSKQSVLYYNLATINQSKYLVWRLVRHLTGHAYTSFLDEVLNDVVKKIRSAINHEEVGYNSDENVTDKITISLFGFSDGATLVRHFGAEYVKRRLMTHLGSELRQARVQIELDAEYLFDSIALPAPVSVSVINRFDIFSFEPTSPYYQSEIPSGTKCVHLVALDEFEKSKMPLLVNQSSENIEEVWVAGDHLDNGGGHMFSAQGTLSASDHALYHMVLRAKQNGLEFNTDFLEQLAALKSSRTELPPVHYESQKTLSPAFLKVRNVFVQKHGLVTHENPVVHESVLTRMAQATLPYYEPPALQPFNQVEVVQENGERASARFETKPTTPLLQRYEDIRLKASGELKAMTIKDDSSKLPARAEVSKRSSKASY